MVVGAGPSGATTALLLARLGHDVVLVDRARFPRDKACGEGVMPPGVDALRRMGLYERVLATGARPLRGVTYLLPGARPRVSVPFPVPPGGGPAHGLGVRRTTFDAVLVEAVRDEPRATVREGERVTGLLRNASATVTGVTTTAGEIQGTDRCRRRRAAFPDPCLVRAERSTPSAHALRARRPLADRDERPGCRSM